MSLDQFTEAVVTLSSAVERAQRELEAAEHGKALAENRVAAARRQLELAKASLDEAVRMKAANDLAPNSCFANLVLFSEPPKSSKDPHWADLAAKAAVDFLRLSAKDTGVDMRLTAPSVEHYQPRTLADPEQLPVSTRIRELFWKNPGTSFTASDVQVKLGIPADREPIVRQTLRRLHGTGRLLREDRGLYRLNPVARAWATEEDRE